MWRSVSRDKRQSQSKKSGLFRQDIIIYSATLYSVASYRPPTNGIQQLYVPSSEVLIFSHQSTKKLSNTWPSDATLLQSVLEAWLALDHLATSINTLVGSPELEGEREGDEDDEAVGDHAGHDSWAVTWGIDLTENSCERVSLWSLYENG